MTMARLAESVALSEGPMYEDRNNNLPFNAWPKNFNANAHAIRVNAIDEQTQRVINEMDTKLKNAITQLQKVRDVLSPYVQPIQ
jgi:hypothetical protein